MSVRLVLVSLLVAVVSTVTALPASADSAKSLGKSGDWESFAYTDKSGKVCYAASLPKRSLNAPKGRAETYVSITHRPNDKSFDVVSVAGGFTYKKDAPAEIDINGAKFDFYTTGDSAWARNDKAVVQAMLKGKSLVVHGTPVKGDQTADTYSLDGFVKAYADIGKACGAK
ncbi:invasion associated locus B family protein [Telmatospirillum sp.]|uniref:invasion associated locus B family protein n=1 Tax=Telmatospirillum sp. TaxID=2079197 RepID=UPI00284C4B32|nr:invasion associated locus B family protein [Telmatospirillum sp.]MDR3438692.1 invasion associated locus B family protein [Telmatospirillum sp.]